MRRSRRTGGSLLVVVAVLATACSDDDDASDSTAAVAAPETTDAGEGDIAAGEWTPATRAEELALAMSDGDGASLQDAVDEFALFVPDFPGARPSDHPTGTGLSGTSALALISAFREQLDDDQVAALDVVLDAGDVVATITPDGDIVEPTGAPTSQGWRRSGPTPADVQEYSAYLAEVQQAWAAHLPGHPKHQSYELAFSKVAVGEMDAQEPTGHPERCRIRVRNDFIAGKPEPDKVRWMFAHELFHCMQFRWAAQGGGSWNPHLWVVDGSAEFAAADLYRTTELTYNNLFFDWFTSELKPLGSRQYDAWALFENAYTSGYDVYSSIIAMLKAPAAGVGAMLAVGHLDGQIFRIDWSTRTLRWPEFGLPWRLDWPWGGHASYGPEYNNVFAGTRGLGSYNVVGVGKFAQPQFLVTMTPDVGLVTVSPHGSPVTTRSANGTVTVADGGSDRFCFDPGGCVCPSGQSSGASPMDGPVMVVSFAAVAEPPRAGMFAEPWDPDKHCRHQPPEDASSDGDPHLVSFDSLPFDITALGEFVLARDPDGDFEVQTRHEVVSWAAGTTAVAIGTGGHRVTLTMPTFVSTDPVAVRVDGRITTEPVFDVGEARVSVDPDTVVAGSDVAVAWPDGSTVRLHWALGWFVELSASGERAARMDGLLGHADGDLRNDLTLPDGTVLDTSDVSAPDSAYAAAWAVDSATTLFDYEPGQSVDTFRIQHPTPGLPAIDPEASERCRARLGPDVAAYVVDACAYDVSATGDETFVETYATVLDEREQPVDVDLDATLPPIPSAAPATAAEGVSAQAGVPTLVLDREHGSGTVDAVAGTVLVARATGCGEVYADVVVVRSGEPELLARSALCDPSGLPAIGLGEDDEWINGEAYIWLPGDGAYDVTVDIVLGNAEELTAVEVFVDPAPLVLDDAALAEDVDTELHDLGDTVVLLANPSAVVTTSGLDRACAVEVYWGDQPFPSDEPRALGACVHDDDIAFPASATVIPVVVFSRTAEPVDVGLTPAD